MQVRLPGNRSHSCVLCINKNGCVTAGVPFYKSLVIETIGFFNQFQIIVDIPTG